MESREKQGQLSHWFIFQMATTVRVRSGLTQEPRASSRSLGQLLLFPRKISKEGGSEVEQQGFQTVPICKVSNAGSGVTCGATMLALFPY